jgi:hypothetical protein
VACKKGETYLLDCELVKCVSGRMKDKTFVSTISANFIVMLMIFILIYSSAYK